PLSNCELEELMPVLLTTTIDAGVPMATSYPRRIKVAKAGTKFSMSEQLP
ncbi:unnamed protein product, partial [Rotaria socialis]